MPWVWLILAGVCEVIWAIGLKKYGFWPASRGAIVTVAIMILSFILLAQAMKGLPVGTAYPIWTGIGAVGAALLGMFYLGEPRDWPRMVCIGIVVIGIVGLKMLSPAAQDAEPANLPASGER